MRNQHGIGLIEVLISVTLGLVLLAALLKSYSDSKATFRVQDSQARLQENARYAMHLISHDLRMAGYRACARDGTVVNTRSTLNAAADFLYDFLTPVQGHDGNSDGSWSPSLPVMLGSASPGRDVLVMRGALDAGTAIRQAMTSTSADLHISNQPGAQTPEAGDIYMISDCLGSAIFQVTRHASGTIEHDTGSSLQPGNISRDLGRRYPLGASIFPMGTVSYFVREGNGGPSLWRKTNNSPAQEMVEGVQDIQLQFGLDTDGDRMPDVYAKATNVPDFRQVVSLRVALLFRGLEPIGSDPDQRSFTLLDRVVGPFDDGHLYQVLTSTITLRNKAV